MIPLFCVFAEKNMFYIENIILGALVLVSVLLTLLCLMVYVHFICTKERCGAQLFKRYVVITLYSV